MVSRRQCLLAARRMPCPMTVEEAKLGQMLSDIERDNVSGSVRMSRKTATLVEEAASFAEENDRDVAEEVAKWARAAAEAHPFMALVRTVGRRSSMARSVNDLRKRMDRLRWEMENGNQRIGERMVHIFPEGGTFMTNSFSATVHAGLKHLVNSGVGIRTIVVESRPAREGSSWPAPWARWGSGAPSSLMLASPPSWTGPTPSWWAGIPSAVASS